MGSVELFLQRLIDDAPELILGKIPTDLGDCEVLVVSSEWDGNAVYGG
jgi:hypothetical protein